MIIKGYRVAPLLKRTGKEILDDNVLGLAAQTAYYFFFSLFPLFLFMTPLLGIVGDEHEIMNNLVAQIRANFPPEAVAIFTNMLEDVVFSESAPGLMSTGLLLTAWTGSNIFSALIDSLNRAYDVPKDDRPWWKKKLIALGAVFGAGAVMLVATTIMLGGDKIAGWIGDKVGLGEAVTKAWIILQYPVAFAMLVGLAWLVYYFLPYVKQRKSHALVGALVATVLWVLATLLFRAYVVNFGSYNKTYGTIGGVIVLLTWMYYSMVVLLIGGELNGELHHGTAAIKSVPGTLYAGRVATGGEPAAPSTLRVEQVSPTKPLPVRRAKRDWRAAG